MEKIVTNSAAVNKSFQDFYNVNKLYNTLYRLYKLYNGCIRFHLLTGLPIENVYNPKIQMFTTQKFKRNMLKREGITKAVSITGASANTPMAAATIGTRPPSRFAMFVHLYNGVESPFPGGQRKWTFRGDAYDNHEPYKQLRYLLNKLNNYGQHYHVAYITDNSIPKEGGEQLVIKWHKGVITHLDGIYRYGSLLQGYPIPNFMKKYLDKWT